MSKVKEIKKILDAKCKYEPKEFMVKSMGELLGLDYPGMVPVWVVRAPGKEYGAYGILHRDVQDEVYKKTGGDYWIIPSSIHEILCVGKDIAEDRDGLMCMVKCINHDYVDPMDQLADVVWSFSYDSYGNGVIE